MDILKRYTRLDAYGLFINVGVPSSIVFIILSAWILFSNNLEIIGYAVVLSVVSLILCIVSSVPIYLKNRKHGKRMSIYDRVRQQVREERDHRIVFLEQDNRFKNYKVIIHNIRETLVVADSGNFAMLCDATDNNLVFFSYKHIRDIEYKKYDDPEVENELVIRLKNHSYVKAVFVCIHPNLGELIADNITSIKRSMIGKSMNLG